MIVPEEKIEEIRSSASIVDVISEYVPLKKRGRNYIGNCPFHKEKTPSFTVSPDKQIYYCFGCHAGGNVFKFLMEYENISFIESLQLLAKKQGIVLETSGQGQSKEKQSELEEYYDINTAAARYFSSNLLENRQSEAAREYLHKRGIKPATQRAFGLGYALPGWDGFVNYAKSAGVDHEKARVLGLVEKKENGGYYDKFRGRVIFPIFSANGRVIAFGGRIMENAANTAKYLNSPESAVYFKRKTLYGLFHSKDEIRRLDRALLVEGYLDLISLYQAGVKNVVATCGTALTEEQAQILSRYTKNIVVFYDSDNAGIKASLRSIEIFLKQDFDVRIAELPSGEDPDSYVQKNGKAAIEEAVSRSLNFLEYQTAQFEKQGMLSDPVQMTSAIRKLVETASFVNDELKRTVLLKSISKKYGLREKLLEEELEKYKQSSRSASSHRAAAQRSPAQRSPAQGSPAQGSPAQRAAVQKRHSGPYQQTQASHQEPLPPLPEYMPEAMEMTAPEGEYQAQEHTHSLQGSTGNDQVSAEKDPRYEVSLAEREIMSLLFQGDARVIDYIFNNLTPEDFTLPAFQNLAELVYDAFVNGGDILPGALIDKIEDTKSKEYILKATIEKYTISKNWEQFNPGVPEAQKLMKYARDAIRNLRLFKIDREIKANYEKIRMTSDEMEIMELMKYNSSLIEERKIIQNA